MKFSKFSPHSFDKAWLFAYLGRPASVARLLPPSVKLKVVRFYGSWKQVGSRCLLKVAIGPFWVNWTWEITEWVEGSHFTITQVEGPFSHWLHTCRLKEEGIEDVIVWAAPWYLVSLDLRKKFEKLLFYRHEVLMGEARLANRLPKTGLKILLSGSTGLIGSACKNFLEAMGHFVTPLQRKQGSGIFWDPQKGIANPTAFEGFDAVIHLSGKNIGQSYWTKQVKEEIFLSRFRDTWFLSQVLRRVTTPPKVFIGASAIGYYGKQVGVECDEESGSGSGFLAEVCREWEKASRSLEEIGARRVIARFGLVLSGKGGVLPRMALPFRLGVGLTIGEGSEAISWISIDDLLYGIYHSLFTEELAGAVNFTSPIGETSLSFAKQLAHHFGTRVRGRISPGLIEKGLGEMGRELLLMDCNALPKKLSASQFSFSYSKLEQALSHLL